MFIKGEKAVICNVKSISKIETAQKCSFSKSKNISFTANTIIRDEFSIQAESLSLRLHEENISESLPNSMLLKD